MRTIRFGLILLSLSCAEPTATSPRSAAPAMAKENAQNNSYLVNAADRAVYVRLAQVRTESGEPIHAFIRRMFESADSADAQRLVIDLRSISGSDTRLLVPLISGVIRRDRFVQHGGLYLVVGPNNFSRGQTAATLLQQYANPILVRD